MNSTLKKLKKKRQLSPAKEKSKHIGFVDNHWGPKIRGWACNTSNLNKPVWVRVTGDGVDRIVEADQYRSDIEKKGIHPNGHCGFSLELSEMQSRPVKVSIIEEVSTLDYSQPLYHGRKLFFMHIAKTAGSSVNHDISSQYNAGEFCFHIEGQKDTELLYKKKFISGHVNLDRFKHSFSRKDYILFSFLRNPIDQLVSHLYWVRHLSEPGIENFKSQHPPVVQKLSEKMHSMNFSNKDQMKFFVENLSNIEAPLFDNCQCRYFNPIPANKRYSQNNAVDAITYMESFDVIGITEQYEKSMNQLERVMGWTRNNKKVTRENVNRYDYGLDKTDKDILEILSPLVQYDQILYDAGLKRFNQIS